MSEDALGAAVAGLRQATSLEDVQRLVRTAGRQLVRAQGATFVIREGDQCYYADEDAISPLWKGQRFKITECISGWAMLHGQPAVIADIWTDQRIPQAAYRPTFVRSLLMVPVPERDPVAAIGAYWSRPRHATGDEVARLTALANAAGAALARLPSVAALPRTLAEHATLADRA